MLPELLWLPVTSMHGAREHNVSPLKSRDFSSCAHICCLTATLMNMVWLITGRWFQMTNPIKKPDLIVKGPDIVNKSLFAFK